MEWQVDDRCTRLAQLNLLCTLPILFIEKLEIPSVYIVFVKGFEGGNSFVFFIFIFGIPSLVSKHYQTQPILNGNLMRDITMKDSGHQ